MQKCILIVDDSSVARSILKRILEISGFGDSVFREANSGKVALEILKNQACDLIFTDLNMPDMDGKKLISRIKSSPRLNHIPVIITSSLGQQEKQDKVLRQAAAVFPKPLSMPEISGFLEIFKDNSRTNKDEN